MGSTEKIFKGNVVLLTGASAGIGKELALQLAAEGAHLALCARSAEALEAVAEECRQVGAAAGTRVLTRVTDVGDEAQCRQLVEATVAEFGRLDTLINNAGISMWALFEDMETLEPFERIMRVNYFGSVYCTHYALPYLKQSRGRLVGVASLTGKTGVPTRSGYAASKHAMAGFFDTLRIELADSGVSVTMIYPDFVKSEVRSRAFGPDGATLGESPVQEDRIMTAATCAAIIRRAAARRQREVITSLRGKLGSFLKLFFPSILDGIARRAIARGR